MNGIGTRTAAATLAGLMLAVSPIIGAERKVLGEYFTQPG